jgi:hypothetical protein
VHDILARGNRVVRDVARDTMERVREAMGLTYFRD